jgi:hypothetical protein
MNEEIDSPESIVAEAEHQGWVSKENFRGRESDWVDAETFVKRGREIAPLLRKNNENLMRDLTATKEQLKEFREAAEEFKKFQMQAYERKANDYERQIQEIKENRAQAISDGDGQKVNALDDALDEAKDSLKEAKQAVKDAVTAPTQTQAIEPGLQTWLNRNEWFGKDTRMTAMANGLGESIRLDFPDLKGQAFVDKLDELLAEEFPTKFGKSKVSPRNPIETGAGRQYRSGGSAQSYDNLPSEAKAACDRFVKQKLMTREQYVSEFDWS